MITMILGVDVTHPAINESTHQQVKSLSERWSKVWNWSEQRKAQLLKVFYHYEFTWMSKRPKTFRKYISYFHIKSRGGPRVATFENYVVEFTWVMAPQEEVWWAGGGTVVGYLTKGFKERLRPSSDPSPFYIPVLTEKVPLWYTFY